jgi:hypothetical protein
VADKDQAGFHRPSQNQILVRLRPLPVGSKGFVPSSHVETAAASGPSPAVRWQGRAHVGLKIHKEVDLNLASSAC